MLHSVNNIQTSYFSLHQNWKYEAWLTGGGERLFQLLVYSAVVEQDRVRSDKGHFQERESWCFSVVSRVVVDTRLLVYRSPRNDQIVHPVGPQSPVIPQILLHPCIPVPHRMTKCSLSISQGIFMMLEDLCLYLYFEGCTFQLLVKLLDMLNRSSDCHSLVIVLNIRHFLPEDVCNIPPIF